MNAAFSSSSTCDTVEEVTAANMIIAVVRGGEFSACWGLNTVSMAKKVPATGALKPAVHNVLIQECSWHETRPGLPLVN